MNDTDKTALIKIIEKSLDEGFSNHIPLTSDFLAARLIEAGVCLNAACVRSGASCSGDKIERACTENVVSSMDRLTTKDERGRNIISTRDEWGYSTCGSRLTIYGCIPDKLAAYEDTGVSPEDIAALITDNKRLHKLLNSIEDVLKGSLK